MNKKTLLNSRWPLLLFGLLILSCCLEVRAQIKFVQISDPHMFDEEKEASDNKTAFVACIRQINEEMAKGADYKFVVITGDIGIENLVSVFEDRDGKRERKFQENEDIRNQNISKGAAELASIIAPSKVKVWLFVPGNNDLFNEEITTLNFYQRFIDELAKKVTPWGITVKDLCRREHQQGSGNAQPATYTEGSYAFIGFNDASFKNNNDPGRIMPGGKGSATTYPGIVSLNSNQIKEKQEEYVQQVLEEIDKYGAYAYVFYHIPEIDDPYLISGGTEQKILETLQVRSQSSGHIEKANENSAWFVAPSVRELWDEAVKKDKVKALFAGHFHSKDRDIYQSYHWMHSAEYLSGSLSKLYVCPPLAVKLQVGEKQPARGFQEISINKEGWVLMEDGRPGVHIFWYDPATGTFSQSAANKADEEAHRNLQLGSLLEKDGRFKEAEAAYTKALEADSPQLSDAALSSLRFVVEKQISPLNRYVLTPLGISLSHEGIYLLLSIFLFLVLAAIWRVLGYYLSDRKRHERHFLLNDFILATLSFSLFMAMAYLIRRGKNFSMPASAIIILTVAVLLLCLGFLWLIFKRARRLTVKRGKNKLIIISLADTTSGKLASTLPSVFATTRQEIISEREFEGTFSSGTTLPIVILAEDTELAELVETTVSGRWGSLLGWLLRRTTQAEYSVRAALQSSGGNTTLIMSLEAAGESLKMWSDTRADALLHEGQRDLAYQVLIYIFRRINYGVGYDDAS